ncbi:MAG: hypothetical protein QOJ99_3014 [Bryobacterales bacterium]|nr:hypothetical protein [Bryobacterales bacterium]
MRNLLTHKLLRYPLCITIAALCGIADTQQGLTTIQDTLFKADGTRFTGTLTIHWGTFDANNIGTIVQQSRSVQVLNGNLQVQLAPNSGMQAPANTYTVMYQSDGREQFTETWTVAASTQALRVADVRTGMITSSNSAPGNQTPIVESAVVGLVADLAQRPVKGAGFGTGSVAVINQNGQIETVVGNVGDCVLADGTTGPCGGPVSVFFDGETPAGLVDGTNNTFTLLNAPSGLSLSLFRNGMYMKASFDYTLNGSTLRFVPGIVPQPLDTLVANYRVDPDFGPGNLRSPTLAGTAAAQVLCSASGKANVSTTLTSLGSCDIPALGLKPGDRIEVRFTFAHTGTASGFDVQLNWGSKTVFARHGGTQDLAFAGQTEAAVTSGGAQITVQSWGSVLPFLPAITNATVQNGVKVDLLGSVSKQGSDSITLTNYTVLRYPGK